MGKNMKFAFYGQIATALGCYGGTLPEGFEQPSDKITPGLECGGASANSKIVGGRAADQNTWPWLIMLAVTDSDGFTGQCGGTILSDTRILTAAHCFSSDQDQVDVYVGNYKQRKDNEVGEFTTTATKVTIHESYQSTTDQAFDFAILEIPSLASTKPDDCEGCYATACLPSQLPQHGRACWVGGWGTTRSGGSVSNKQKEVGVTVFSAEYCQNVTYYETGDIDFNVEFCAGTPDTNNNGFSGKGADSCQGDSGGPFICEEDNEPVLYGVVSWGIGCGAGGYAGVYANVFAELAWINGQL